MRPKLSDYQQRMRQYTASKPVEWKAGERDALIAEAVEQGRVMRVEYLGRDAKTFDSSSVAYLVQRASRVSPFFDRMEYRDVLRAGNVISV